MSALVAAAFPTAAQTCQSSADIELDTRKALETTATRFFDMAARGDIATMQQNSIPAVAGSFAGIEAALKEHQASLSAGQSAARASFLLSAEGKEPLAHAEFLCGVFGKNGQTANSAVFALDNLPPGNYGVVIMDAKPGGDATNNGADSVALTVVLNQIGVDWRLAGLYVRPTRMGGRDGPWFAARARDFKDKGQTWNAWLYYREAMSLTAPVDFMSTLATDKLYDDAQAVVPADLPQPDHPLSVTGITSRPPQAGTDRQPASSQTARQFAPPAEKTFAITHMFPMAVGKDLDVVVKYQTADVSNTGQIFQDNMAVIRGLVARLPELREAFVGVVARAVEPSGRDYGSLLAMKDIK